MSHRSLFLEPHKIKLEYGGKGRCRDLKYFVEAAGCVASDTGASDSKEGEMQMIGSNCLFIYTSLC